MRIINICTCHNHLRILPFLTKYYQDHRIELFMLDTGSTDGSSIWLLDHKIPHASIDPLLVREARKEIARQLKADWVIEGNASQFIYGVDLSIDRLIFEADKASYSHIKCREFTIHQTDEEDHPQKHPREIFFFFKEENTPIEIYKNKQGKSCSVNAFILNYALHKHEAKENLQDLRMFEPLKQFLAY